MKNNLSKMKRILFAIIISGFVVSCNSYQQSLKKEFTVVSYNVENLFDTVDDPNIPDEEFLPESEKKWDNQKYQQKLNDISRVISEINPKDFPEIVGLVEVENRTVLSDLVNTERLKKIGYDIVHEESPDFRGIDVALLFRKSEFKLIRHETLPVVFENDPEFKTRDILYVTGSARGKILHVFVNHWPSRIGGEEQTEPKRVLAASVVKAKIDRIVESEPDAAIIVMGDMNDEPANKSMDEVLGAGEPDSSSKLVNLMYPDDKLGDGTYFYNGGWNMLDNIIVSKSVISGNDINVIDRKGNIYRNDWMIYTNSKGDKTPNRSYVGNKYVAGVSDHFPVFFKLTITN